MHTSLSLSRNLSLCKRSISLFSLSLSIIHTHTDVQYIALATIPCTVQNVARLNAVPCHRLNTRLTNTPLSLFQPSSSSHSYLIRRRPSTKSLSRTTHDAAIPCVIVTIHAQNLCLPSHQLSTVSKQ